MKWLLFLFLALVVAGFVYVSADLPDRADPRAPATVHLSPDLIEATEHDIGIPNIVTAVLADIRSYDTLGETIVIFTAGVAVLLILMRGYRDDQSV